ncbi:MAG: C25 family cysteine peptidase, partial [Candidatus Micrarchaeota archaeon]
MTRGLPPLEGQDFTDKIVLADACYGGNPYRAEGESLPILFLRNGAVAFFGSTTSALANRKVSAQNFDDEREILALGSSTALHYRVLKGLAQGERIGDAVKAARREMQYGNAADELTAIQYVLYGDPTLRTGS